MSGHISTPTPAARSRAGGELLAQVARIVWEGDAGGPIIFRTPANAAPANWRRAASTDSSANQGASHAE